MRIVKEAEGRRDEILDAAEKLFAAKGFDSTSTGDILDAVGIAKRAPSVCQIASNASANLLYSSTEGHSMAWIICPI